MVPKRMDDSMRRSVRAGRLPLAGKTPAHAAQGVGVARPVRRTRGRRCSMTVASMS